MPPKGQTPKKQLNSSSGTRNQQRTLQAPPKAGERGVTSTKTHHTFEAVGESCGRVEKRPTNPRTHHEDKPSPVSQPDIQILLNKIQNMYGLIAENEENKTGIVEPTLEESAHQVDKLSEYITITRSVRKINADGQEKKKDQETAFKIQNIHEWLKKLKEQVRKDEYVTSVFEIKQKTDGEMKKCKEILGDICKLLSDRCEEKKTKDSEQRNILDALDKEISNLFPIPKGASIVSDQTEDKKGQKKLEYLKAVRSGTEGLKTKSLDIFQQLNGWKNNHGPENNKKIKRNPKPVNSDSKVLDVITESEELQNEHISFASETSNTLKQLEEKIEDLWQMVDGSSNTRHVKKPANFSASSIADHLRTHFMQNKDKIEGLLDNIKSEIACLENDIKYWNGDMENGKVVIDKNSHSILKATREARKELDNKKKIYAEELSKRTNEKGKREQKLKEHALEVRKQILGTSRKPSQTAKSDDGRRDDVMDILQEVSAELCTLETAAFKIEEGFVGIIFTATGIEVDADNTSSLSDVILKTEQKMKSCQAEMKLLHTSFQELEKVILNNSMADSMATKCKSITEVVTRWKEENAGARSTIENVTTSLLKTLSSLVADPYQFHEPRLDKKGNSSDVLDVSDWMQQITQISKQLEKCVEENKPGFKHRFLEMDTVKPQLEEIHMLVLNKEYSFPNEDGRETKQRKPDSGKSRSKRLRASDSSVVVTDMLSKIQEGLSKNVANYEQNMKDLEKLRKENQVLLTRLSAVAGAKLTDNNPNIADLSDGNRPTKIAEFYSELYDNEWTDAFDVFEKARKPAKDALQLLRNILITVYQECAQYAERQEYVLKTILVCPTAELSIAENGDSHRSKSKQLKVELPAVLSRLVAELRKKAVTECSDDVSKNIMKKFREWFKEETLEKYTTRCIRVCWLMQIQTPPVHIDTDVEVGSKFDKEKYKEYTKSGKKVDYVVWPALYLTKGGAILSKGVAQGK